MLFSKGITFQVCETGQSCNDSGGKMDFILLMVMSVMSVSFSSELCIISWHEATATESVYGVKGTGTRGGWLVGLGHKQVFQISLSVLTCP